MFLHYFLLFSDCSHGATHGELAGPGAVDLNVTTYSGSNEKEKDESCCQQCSENSECEYWVRATRFNKCWLKSNRGGKIEGSSGRGLRRGGLRESKYPQFSYIDFK